MAGLGGGRRNSYIPKWLLDLDVAGYDDRWDDWSFVETSLIKERIKAGHNPEIVFKVFSVPDSYRADILSATDKDAPLPPKGKQIFTEKHIPDREMREYANTRWDEYSQRLDMTVPTNATTVRSLIILEIQMQRMETQMLNPATPTDKILTLNGQYARLQDAYSNAAEDVAQLEKQREHREQVNTFAEIVLRTHAIDTEWDKNRTRVHMELEESHLIRHMAMLYKTRAEKNLSRKTPEAPGDVNATNKTPMNDFAVHEEIMKRSDPKDVVTVLPAGD